MKTIYFYTIMGILFGSVTGCNTNHSDSGSSNAQNSPTSTVDTLDPMPSWNDGPSKKAIIHYVRQVTTEGSPDFIPVADRIATFDNDGTLWSEQPVYFQFFFAMDQIKALAVKHPEWKNKQPYKAVLENNMDEIMKQGTKGILQIVAASHANMTTDAFESAVKAWIDTAKNPVKHKLYKDLVYQPMLELIKYLQSNHFKTFIVSGGGIEFMRPWAEKAYGIPKNQIIGSSIKAKYDYNNGNPRIDKVAELDFNDDKEGKPVAIQKYIGRKPIFAAGNSDGDLQMLQWTASNSYKTLELYVHHTDSVREWSYDRQSAIGRFDKGLDEARQKNWIIVNMKDDWKVIYPFELNK